MRNWALLLLCLTPLLQAGDKRTWIWKDAQGRVRTQDELNQILQANALWFSTNEVEGKRADFSGSNLYGAVFYNKDFAGVKFHEANLRSVTFSNCNLRNAAFSSADLRGAQFTKSDVGHAGFGGANLTDAQVFYSRFANANVMYASLKHAFIFHSDFSNASLNEANLEDALILEVNLDKADFTGSDLKGTTYEPINNPAPSFIATAIGLSDLTWANDPGTIFSLRKALFDAGFRDAAKQLTTAIHRHDQGPFEQVFFDWTCSWGSNSFRPLMLVAFLAFGCTFIYWIGMHFGSQTGLYLVATGQRVVTSKGKEHAIRISLCLPQHTAPSAQLELDLPELARSVPSVSLRRKAKREITGFLTAFLFSLMSVFNIGFREFNFGRWIRMLQTREFDIRARGWMRTVSGIQSLLGVALVALSLLSYFGRPFD